MARAELRLVGRGERDSLPGFNPEMMSWIEDASSGKRIPIVPLEHLMDFTGSEGSGRAAGYVLGIKLTSSAHDFDGEPPDFIYTNDPQRHRYLRVDYIESLYSDLVEGALELDGVGEEEIMLLGRYCDKLFSRPETSVAQVAS